jgi:hypothetical protein
MKKWVITNADLAVGPCIRETVCTFASMVKY